MSRLLFCWRCGIDVPMLTDEEWEQVLPLLQGTIKDIQAFRARNGVSLKDAENESFGQAAREKYEQLTGLRETNVHAIWHHRASMYGPPCKSCGKPLRTPQAKLCAGCGKFVA